MVHSPGRAIILALLLTILVLVTGRQACAACGSTIQLEGFVAITCCTPENECIPASMALYEYAAAVPDDPTIFTICMHASPWHMYDGEYRILSLAELAEMIRPRLEKDHGKIVLIASWTGVAPERTGTSIAGKLSKLLKGFPVQGMDGFVWLTKDGTVRTTRQAFTGKPQCPYGVRKGEDVMASLVAGWPVEYEEHYVKAGDAEGLLRAGAGWDIYMLCPEKALKAFERAATLANPIAAYNAAVMRLERGKPGDLRAAKVLLGKAAALGDQKSRALLRTVGTAGH